MDRLHFGVGCGGGTILVSLMVCHSVVALVLVTVSISVFLVDVALVDLDLVDVERVVAFVLVDVWDEVFELRVEIGAGTVPVAPASQLWMQ